MKFKKGDWVRTKDGRVGQIRYIGRLKKIGIKRQTIWSSWEILWNGKLIPASPLSYKGQLSPEDPKYCKKLTQHQMLKRLRKKYNHYFQYC